MVVQRNPHTHHKYACAGVSLLLCKKKRYFLIILCIIKLSICVKGIDELVETTEQNEPGTFHGDFHMEFCDNKKQLFQAYFRDFTIERLESPWQAFTGGWYVKSFFFFFQFAHNVQNQWNNPPPTKTIYLFHIFIHAFSSLFGFPCVL